MTHENISGLSTVQLQQTDTVSNCDHHNIYIFYLQVHLAGIFKGRVKLIIYIIIASHSSAVIDDSILKDTYKYNYNHNDILQYS